MYFASHKYNYSFYYKKGCNTTIIFAMQLSISRQNFGYRIISLLMLLGVLFSCNKNQNTNTRFSLLSSQETGIDFTNQLVPSPDLNILNYIYYYNGGGVAAGDFNNDGLIDLYFSGNQTQDKLYINKGNFAFEPLAVTSGIDNSKGWTTGVTTVDINQDGLLDIYVSKVGDYKSLKGHNLLFVNQGVNAAGQLQFVESAAKYGLDFSGFSTQASFFDYDLDGDLDMYLLNHSVQPNSNYGIGSKRKQVDSLSGDRLYKNTDGFYTDVSAQAGINQGTIGYGLGLTVSDVNQDGYPDIYVGNDFFENDYLYLNQKDGTFIEVIASQNNPLGHTTHYSMGNDIADVNNDGLLDIVSVDMLPEDLKTLKTSGVEFGFQTYQNYLKNGYEPQYMQNTLHINRGGANFSEVAHQSGIAATDWSWSPLLADFDNDGFNDLFVTNGIVGATNDMDFINFIANDNIQKALNKGMTQSEMDFINKLPQKQTPNFIYKNNGDLSFSNKTTDWMGQIASFSNGAVYADLNNDGSLDLVVNNVNESAFIFKNNGVKDSINTNYITIKLKAPKGNLNAIGASVSVYSSLVVQTKQLTATRGYLSAVSRKLHFGLGSATSIDSVKIIWPDGSTQLVNGVKANQFITINKEGASQLDPKANSLTLLKDASQLLSVVHRDNQSVDFNRDPLIPFASSNLGPAMAIGDLNNDGLDDIFLGGGKGQTGQLSLQIKDGSFSEPLTQPFLTDALSEDVGAVVFDSNMDGLNELLVVSGGNEFLSGESLTPRLYRDTQGSFVVDSLAFKNIEVDASSVTAVDFDQDGDTDVLITSGVNPRKFGETPRQYLLANDGTGTFTDVTSTIAPTLEKIGAVKDAVWMDINADGWQDLVVVGHWMAPTIFINKQGVLTKMESNLDAFTGWWNTVKVADFDNDGDLDMVAGNWGHNTRLKATEQSPVTLYRQDFDDNGSVETLVTYFYKGIETPFVSKDELVKQLPAINKNFLSYENFAQASLDQLFGTSKLNTAIKKQVTTLSSSYFENLGNGQFNISSLPFWAQVSQVNDIFVKDFNGDGYNDLFLVGNNHFISTQLGQLDGQKGELLFGDGTGIFGQNSQMAPLVYGSAQVIKRLKIKQDDYLIIGVNNAAPILLKLTN
jgi:hypothetical protein